MPDPSSRLRLVVGRGNDIDAEGGVSPLQADLDILLRRLLGPEHTVRVSRDEGGRLH